MAREQESPASVKSDSSSIFLVYSGLDETCELLEDYEHHGLHPIILGEVLPKTSTCITEPDKIPRYRIHLKIGFGAFSTVWLAFDLEKRRWVALKVCRGNDEECSSTEARILEHVHKTRQPGFEHIIQLYDAFVIRGPNGNHQCIVTEVVVPWSALSIDFWKNLCSRRVIKQLSSGFSCLHDQGIVHGDPTITNIGISLPQINDLTASDIADKFGLEFQMSPLIVLDPSYAADTVPAYMTNSMTLFPIMQDQDAGPVGENLQLRVMDFGRAFWTNEPRDLLGGCPGGYRPPEVLVHEMQRDLYSAWSEAADVWAVACLFFIIDTGRFVFKGSGTFIDKLLEFVQLAGGGTAPEEWYKSWPQLRPQLHAASTKVDLDKEWQLRGADQGLGACDPRLLRLVRRMLVLEPGERPRLADVLDDPYIKDLNT